MRALVIVCLLVGVAGAESQLPLYFTPHGNAGEWTMFEGKRREGGKLVPDRVIAKLVAMPDKTSLQIALFRGPIDAETYWTSHVVGVNKPPKDGMKDVYLVSPLIKDFKQTTEPCKLAVPLTCDKTTFTQPNGESFTLLTSTRVSGICIVSLEIADAKGPVWQLRVIGYGKGNKAEWGGPPSKAKLDAPPPPEPEKLGTIGNGDWGNRKPTISNGAPDKVGSLDKEIIKTHIRASLQRITACYEKALVDDPKLAGTVNARFEILATGKVGSSTADGIRPDVANCIAAVIAKIEFPKPQGGGKVDIKYPFNFRPADDAKK